MVFIFAALAGVALFCLIMFVGLFLMWSKRSRVPAPAPKDRRLLVRIPVRSDIYVFWQDLDGRHKALKGRAVNISERGASLTAYRAVPRNSVIYVKARQCNFEGSASVRYCQRHGFRYTIGVELRGPLTKAAGLGA